MSVPGSVPIRRPLRRRLLAAAFLLVPIAELAVLIQVGRAVGLGVTLLLLLGGAIGGALVLRHVGTGAIGRLTAASAAAGGRPVAMPAAAARPGAETALLVLSGLLLIVPGFLSDVLGLALLVPQVRRAVARRAGAAVVRRFQVRAVRVVPGEVLVDDGAGTSRSVPVEVRVIDARPPQLPPTTR